MIDVTEVLELHASTVEIWHQQDVDNTYTGVWQIICQQHIFNFQLWHQEDIARSPTATDTQIADVKRNIDRLNQARNDHIEKIDDWITAELQRLQIACGPNTRLNTETPGSAIDRLSIMSLRLYHYQEQLERTDVDEAHIHKVQARIEMCTNQRDDLARSLTELLSDIKSGQRMHKTYRQMKMYNDPSLNPYLYKPGAITAS